MNIGLYDLVELIGKTEDYDLPPGQQGYVIMVHPKGYVEVEFHNERGKVIAVSTVSIERLALIRHAEKRTRKTA